MKTFLLLFFTFSIYQSENALKFCGDFSLHANLTRAVERSSDWLQLYYKTNRSEPYMASSMMAALRLSGHQPKYLLAKFKDSSSLTIIEKLKNYLDEQKNKHGNLSKIPPGQLAYIIEAVIAICEDPNAFLGYNLYDTLRFDLKSFGNRSDFVNYFQYSLTVIAFCNGRIKVPPDVVKQLLEGAQKRFTIFDIDISAMILVALSCIRDSSMNAEIKMASELLVTKFISSQDPATGAFGNQYSTGLAVEALLAARVDPKSWDCEKALKNILSYQDDTGSFGTMLANIQVTPALLGQPTTFLRNLSCPTKQNLEDISVAVEVTINGTNPVPEVTVQVPEGTTAFIILQNAADINLCYRAEYKFYPGLGHYITAMCGVKEDPTAHLYWLIYLNGNPATTGVDQLKPKNGDTLNFKYEKVQIQLLLKNP